MDIFFQQLINGLVIGSLYALIALGYTMVYGILGLINFAHGDLFMIGALTGLLLLQKMQLWFPGIPLWGIWILSVILSCFSVAVLSLLIEKVAYRPLRTAPRLAPLITAIGVSFLLQTVAMLFWGRSYHSYPAFLDPKSIDFSTSLSVSHAQIMIVLIAFLVMSILMWVVHRSSLGRAMRATAESHVYASLMGIDTNRVIQATFMMGAVLAAVAGILYASYYGIAHYGMGFLPGIKAFTAAVLGGIGNLSGAMLGGILLGLIESVGASYLETWSFGLFNSSYQDVFSFLILVIVLILRPTGLLGEKIADRA